MSAFESAAAELINDQLPTIDEETGKPVRERLKNPAAAKALFDKMREADRGNAANRAAIQAMYDGESPYDEQALIADGQGGRCNLNFGEAAARLAESQSGYVDLLKSVDRVIETPLDRRKYPANDQVFEWEKTIAEEFTRALREWDKYSFNHLLLSTYFTQFGVAFWYFDGCDDWRWKIDHMANFYVPRDTFATEADLPMAAALRCYTADQLFEKIANEEAATEMGWNVAEVKEAILKSCPQDGDGSFTRWEELQTSLKNNDLYIGYGVATKIRTVHFWVRELDGGKISHYVTLESGNNKEWLYSKQGEYDEMTDCFVGFTHGVGTNGHFHGIRGQGFDIFNMVQMSNRARCQFVDGSMMASSLLLQPVDEDALEALSFTYYGPYAVISPGMTVQQQGNQNLAANMIPVLNDMDSLLDRQAGQYQSTGALDKKERSAFEVKADVSSKAKLTTTQLDLFYDPFQRAMRKVLKRFTRKDYAKTDPGGCLVWKFIERCSLRGVPLEAIYSVDSDQAPIMRAIGAGSPEMRLLIFDEMSQLVPQMDDVGRYNWCRDRAAARVGYEAAGRYFPQHPGTRVAPDAKIAELENSVMTIGQHCTVLPDENHSVHAKTHIMAMSLLNDQLQADPNALAQVIPIMLLMLEHAAIHVETMSDSVILAREAADMRQSLQQLGEIVQNGALQLQKQQRQAAEQQAAQTGQPAQPLDNRLLEDSYKFQAKMQQQADEHRQKMQMQREEFKQKQALRDAETASKLLRP